MTTNQNAVVLESVNDSIDLSVMGINISSSDMALYTKWNMTDENPIANKPAFNIYGSGNKVTLTANRPGKTKITVSNKYSTNTLTINAKCGELYEWTDNFVNYIIADKDIVNILNGDSATVGCTLLNSDGTGKFSWEIKKGSDCIDIIGLTSGTCNIKGKKAGQAIINVTNTLTGNISKEILVNVSNTPEELKAFTYLTTTQNVVTVGQDKFASVSVEVKNAPSNVLSGFTWRSTNTSVATVVGSGKVASVYGHQIGTAKLIVENHDFCAYPLEIIVNVVDPVIARDNPYISCNNIVNCTVDGDMATISAELVGGDNSDATGFTWNIIDSGVVALYASNNSARIKALKEGVTQVIVSHPKAAVSRTILVICEPKIQTDCYITLSESIIKLKPEDESRTITATLVNGNSKDVYDFKWWADSYDKINMNYTGNSCIIEPLVSGVVTVHCSHPKASSVKDLILYISSYSDFAFSSKSISLTTGTDSFISMEVPATYTDCDISYKSSNNELCTVWGNTAVCTLHPGTVSSGLNSDSCTITAILQTKSGIKMAEAQMLVSVTRKNLTIPYIGMYPDSSSTIITMNKGEKRSISALLYGDSIVDSESAGLNWSIGTSDKIIDFVAHKNYGKTIQIEALASGKTTLNVTHADENGYKVNPLTLYIIVNGASEPSVLLNYSSLELQAGEDEISIEATVINDTGETLNWSVSDSSGCISTQISGRRLLIGPEKPGTATVTCTVPSNGSSASCTVTVSRANKIEFFIYDDESLPENQRTRFYISNLNIYPGESKALHWECIPEKDNVTFKASEGTYFTWDKVSGSNYYPSSWRNPATGKTYSYPSNIGTVVVTGKPNEGTASLQIKSSTSGLMDSINIINSYNYMFTVNKSIISMTPVECYNDSEALYIDYEIRPACSKIYVTNLTSGVNGEGLMLTGSSSYNSSTRTWCIDTHEYCEDTNLTGVVRGTLKFSINYEVNCQIQLIAVNENLVSSGSSSSGSKNFGNITLKMQVYHSEHTFVPQISKQAPYINRNSYGNGINTNYSYYDPSTKSIYLGDGESLEGTVSVCESHSHVNITGVNFVKAENGSTRGDGRSQEKTQKDLVFGNSSGVSTNTHDFNLYHVHDYALIYFLQSGVTGMSFYRNHLTDSITAGSTSPYNEKAYPKDYLYRFTGLSDYLVENKNDTIRECTYVGDLVVYYTDYALSSGELTYKFPVYVVVRNCPCAENSMYHGVSN